MMPAVQGKPSDADEEAILVSDSGNLRPVFFRDDIGNLFPLYDFPNRGTR